MFDAEFIAWQESEKRGLICRRSRCGYLLYSTRSAHGVRSPHNDDDDDDDDHDDGGGERSSTRAC